MLHVTPAMKALKAGCSRLQLPEGTAAELVHFLQIKRVHDQCIPFSARRRNMSPGAAVDKLWHFMLLNTDVSWQVHELVGGVVRHSGTDEDDLDDDAKRLQRLYAMNIMAREGKTPRTSLWADPGTNMSIIQRIWQPEGGALYLCPGLTEADKAALKADLASVYGTMSSSNGRGRKRPADADADANAADGSADSDDAEDSSADTEAVRESEQEHPPACTAVRKYIIVANPTNDHSHTVYLPDSADSMTVAQIKQALVAPLATPAAQMRLVTTDGLRLRLLVDSAVITPPYGYTVLRVLLPSVPVPSAPSRLQPYTVYVKTPLGKTIAFVGKLAPWFLVLELKELVQGSEGYPPDQQRVIFDGAQLNDASTLRSCGIRHGSQVHVVLRLRGC